MCAILVLVMWSCKPHNQDEAKLEAELSWKSELSNGLKFGAGTKATVEGIRKPDGPDRGMVCCNLRLYMIDTAFVSHIQRCQAVISGFVTYDKGSTQTGLYITVEVPLERKSGVWQQLPSTANINAFYRTVLPDKSSWSLNLDSKFQASSNALRISAVYSKELFKGVTMRVDASMYGNNLGFRTQDVGMTAK